MTLNQSFFQVHPKFVNKQYNYYAIYFLVDEQAEVSIKQLAEELVKAFNFQGQIIFDTTKADGQYKKTASNDKLKKYLPDFEFTSFSKAIKESVDWYTENCNIARN